MDKVVLAPCFRGHYTHLVEIDEYANLYVMDEGDKNSKRSALVEWLAQVIVAATTALEPCGYDTEKQRQLMEEVKKENKGQNFWWGLSRYDAEEYRRVEDAEECAEMAEIDMTKPQPCTVFRHVPESAVSTLAWVAKLSEETGEAIQEALKVSRLAEVGGNVHDAEVTLAEELTDVKTVCESWIAALGYDEYLRGEVQKRVNEKNKARGYF